MSQLSKLLAENASREPMPTVHEQTAQMLVANSKLRAALEFMDAGRIMEARVSLDSVKYTLEEGIDRCKVR